MTGNVEVPVIGVDAVSVMIDGVEAPVEGLDGVTMMTDDVEVPVTAADAVTVMISADEPGPPGKVTVKTVAAAVSVVDDKDVSIVGPIGIGDKEAAGDSVVVSSVRVKLAVLMGWVLSSLVIVTAGVGVAAPLRVSTTV